MSEFENNGFSGNPEQPQQNPNPAGAPQQPVYSTPISEYYPSQSTEATQDPKKKIIIVAAAIVAIILVVLLFKGLFSGGNKEEAYNLFDDGMLIFGEKEEYKTRWGSTQTKYKYGIINEKGKVIIDADYDAIGFVGEGRIVAGEWEKTDDGAEMVTMLRDKKGKEVSDDELSQSAVYQYFSDGLLAVCEDDEWGFMNKNGKWVIKPSFYSVGNFVDGIAPAKEDEDDEWGYINKKGKWVIDPDFDSAGEFVDGLAIASKNGKYGFINKKGDWKVKRKYSNLYHFTDNGLAAACDDGEWGFINKKGEWVIENEYADASSFTEEGLALVKDGSKYGYINKKGKMVIDDDYIEASSFSNGLAYVKEDADDDYGYINKKGEMVIDADFTSARSFNKDGIAAVKDGDEWGFINKKGKWVIDPEFKYATSFYDDGYALVCTGDDDNSDDDEYFVINKKGKSVFKDTFDALETYSAMEYNYNFDEEDED